MNDNIIDINDSVTVAILKMGNGNAGAISAMFEMVKVSDYGLPAILHLDDMQIRGELIWVGFKDYCKMDVLKFIDCCINRDPAMIKVIEDYIKLCKKKY